MYCESLDCTQEFSAEQLSEAVNDAAVLGMIAEMAREFVATELYWLYGTTWCCILRDSPPDIIHSKGNGDTFAAAVRACGQAWKEGTK
jgi:hypothetical protein